MTFGRPRQPNDPSVMASVETALSSVARPGIFGERVTLWCRAGTTHGDLASARDILRAACWASDVRVVASARYAHLVVLEVIRHLPAAPPGPGAAGWPGLPGDGGDGPREPALFGGAGHHWPFGLI